MTDCVSTYLRRRDRLIEAGAYDPSSERDACGVGFIADMAAVKRGVPLSQTTSEE